MNALHLSEQAEIRLNFYLLTRTQAACATTQKRVPTQIHVTWFQPLEDYNHRRDDLAQDNRT